MPIFGNVNKLNVLSSILGWVSLSSLRESGDVTTGLKKYTYKSMHFGRFSGLKSDLLNTINYYYFSDFLSGK